MYTIRQHHGHDHELAATDAPGNVVGIILNDLPQFDIKMPFGNKKKLLLRITDLQLIIACLASTANILK